MFDSNHFTHLKFAVGAPSPFGRLAEGPSLRIGPSGIVLHLSFSNPADSEIVAVRHASVRCGLAVAPGIATAMLVWHFEGAKPLWADTPFNICLDPCETHWALPDREPHQHLAIDIVLQDQFGIIRGLRMITMPPQLMEVIEAVVESQVDAASTGRWSLSAYQSDIDRLCRRWPTTKEAMRGASVRANLGQ